MKRLTALVLAALLLFGAVPASAATLLEKFTGQLTEQGFKGQITFSTAGSKTTALSADAWNWLMSAAPRVTVDLTHSLVDRLDGQATVDLLIDGKSAGKTVLLYNDQLMGVSSDWLAGYGEAWYTAARDWNLSLLLQGAAQQDSAWPPLWRLLLAADGADDAWKEQVEQQLVSLDSKLSAWLNTYVATSTGGKGKSAYTQLKWTVPAADVKQEVKRLLAEFYANDALLGLLAQIATAQEAACYLQPGMLPTFEGWVDRIKLSGKVEITRRFNTAGEMILDRVKLPFSAAQALSTLTITVTPDGDKRTWSFQGAMRDGKTFTVSCTPAGQEQIYSGSVEVLLPDQKAEKDRFLVAETTKEGRQIAFDYNLTWDGGKEEYSLTTDRFEQTMQGTLVVKPHSQDLPSQSLAFRALFSSSSSPRSTTRLEATLTWSDLDGGATVTAALSGRTAAPTPVEKLADQEKTTRLDRLTTERLGRLFAQWQKHADAWLQDAADQLLPAALP